jgi:hypothetical protein
METVLCCCEHVFPPDSMVKVKAYSCPFSKYDWEESHTRVFYFLARNKLFLIDE